MNGNQKERDVGVSGVGKKNCKNQTLYRNSRQEEKSNETNPFNGDIGNQIVTKWPIIKLEAKFQILSVGTLLEPNRRRFNWRDEIKMVAHLVTGFRNRKEKQTDPETRRSTSPNRQADVGDQNFKRVDGNDLCRIVD